MTKIIDDGEIQKSLCNMDEDEWSTPNRSKRKCDYTNFDDGAPKRQLPDVYKQCNQKYVIQNGLAFGMLKTKDKVYEMMMYTYPSR